MPTPMEVSMESAAEILSLALATAQTFCGIWQIRLTIATLALLADNEQASEILTSEA